MTIAKLTSARPRPAVSRVSNTTVTDAAAFEPQRWRFGHVSNATVDDRPRLERFGRFAAVRIPPRGFGSAFVRPRHRRGDGEQELPAGAQHAVCRLAARER